MEALERYEFDAQSLVSHFPPEVHDANKRIVFDMACSAGSEHSGTVSFSRWREQDLPETMTRVAERPALELDDAFFSYPASPPNQVEWHLNFAHHHLFIAYGGPLFAQDEMQVAEHPALASLRHAVIDAGGTPMTVKDGAATPVCIMGVQRRCTVATEPDASAGRPYGLYGNAFARASPDTIRRAVSVLDPPTISNVLAMEAPVCGHGQYTLQQIRSILAATLTGFRAAVLESTRSVSPTVKTVIHTGYWGCGAYGGNRRLMPLLQLISACAAGVDRFVFHSGGDAGGYQYALEVLDSILPAGQSVSTNSLCDQIEDFGFQWGVSDGN